MVINDSGASITGTLGVTGSATLSGASFSGTADFNSDIDATGCTTINLGGGHTIVTGSSDITGSATESDMTSMSTSIIPKGNKMFVMFSAPFYVSAANQTIHLYINISGSNVRHAKQYITSGWQQVSFQHIANVTPNATYTVKIRWQSATAVQQRGSTDAERILTVVDLM
jgi:hypothetical protein